MMKIVAAVVAGLAFAGPAFAQEMACDEASIAKVEQAVNAVADAAKKDAASADLKAAKDAMAASDAAGCAAALKKASDAAMAQ
jgi:hypothetical protein